jgi:hypothetical protein
VSAYRVSLLDAAGSIVTSRTEHSLLEAAKTTLAFVGHAHDDDPALLDATGGANVQVRGMGDRELTDAEKDRIRTLFEEWGASLVPSPDEPETWNLA